MNASRGHALEQALAYFRAPGMLSLARERPLPEGVLDVLKLAAGDESLAARYAEASGETPAMVVEASIFFIQQVLFAPDADSYRVLGVNPDAPEARLKENYRWLVRWLHPDRDRDEWNSVYADRVTRAWQDVRRGASVAAGTPVPAAAQAPAPGPSLGTSVVARRRLEVESAGPMISSRTVQRLPMIVLGGLGGLAVLTLLLMWSLQGPRFEDGGSDWAAEMPAEPAKVDEPGEQTVPEPSAPAVATLAPAAVDRPGSTPVQTVAVPLPPAAATSPMPLPTPQEPAAVPQAPEPAPAPAPRVAALAEAAPAAVVPEPRPAPRARRTRPAPVVEETAPAPVAVATQDPAAPVDFGAARALMSNFTQAYSAGDINSLMRLFASDARNNRGDRDAIIYDYQSLFSSSAKRELVLDVKGWMARDDGATLVTSYTAKVRARGNFRSEVSRGQLRFDLRNEGSQLKITRILLQEGG